MSTFRDMVTHRLQPLRHFYQGAHLIVNAVPDAAQAALATGGYIPSGRCMHLSPTTKYGRMPTSKLGCVGHNKIPVWLFRDSDAYSGGFPGQSSASATNIVWADGAYSNLLHFVGLEGYELATSEFKKTVAYVVGQYLIAPEPATNDTAGMDAAGIVEPIALGIPDDKTVVGIVAPGEFSPATLRDPVDPSATASQVLDPDGTKMLAFYTTYRVFPNV